MHRAAGRYDIYVVASRGANLAGLLALAAATALLLPLVALAAGRSVRASVARALGPLERVTGETRSIGPEDLAARVTAPTGQAEVTEVAESINRMLERVERAHRALQSFTADASHELRTPLTHLSAQAQWALAEGRTEAQVRDAVATMEQTIDRMSKLIEELLLIARGENRQLALAQAPFALTLVVQEVREITEAMAHGKELAVRATTSEQVWAMGDADRTRQVLLNLASNAVRYTPSGSVTFTVHDDGGRVGVSVEDTGPGIPPDAAHRVFDRFFRVDRSRSRDLGGTGLGLAIARLLAELQGGTIALESTPGTGSRFTLWLPAPTLNVLRTTAASAAQRQSSR
jgi:signal transduction histidine kinase